MTAEKQLTWDGLTKEQLESIAANGKTADLDEDQLNALLAEASNLSRIHFKRTYSKVLAASAFVINFICVMDGWSVVFWAAEGVLSLWSVLSGMGLGLLGSSYFAYDAYRGYKQERDDIKKSFKLADLRSYALDKLLELNANSHLHPPKLVCSSFDRRSAPTLKESIHFGFWSALRTCFAAVSGSYLIQLLGYISLASLLSGPFGLMLLAATCVAAVSIGAYFAYTHYQMQTTLHRAQEIARKAEYDINKKLNQYNTLKLYCSLKAPSQQSELIAAGEASTVAEEKNVIPNNEGQPGAGFPPKDFYQSWLKSSALSFFKPRSLATRKLDVAVANFNESLADKELLSAIQEWKYKRMFYSDSVRQLAVEKLEQSVKSRLALKAN
jgi:hypothetical protein